MIGEVREWRDLDTLTCHPKMGSAIECSRGYDHQKGLLSSGGRTLF